MYDGLCFLHSSDHFFIESEFLSSTWLLSLLSLPSLQDSDGLLGSVLALLNVDVLRPFLSSFSSLRSLLVGTGSPCVGFSVAKTDPRGTLDPASALVAVLPCLLAHLHALLPAEVQIFFYLENVPMDDPERILQCQHLITSCLGVPSHLLDGALISASSRRRRIWTNMAVQPLRASGVDVSTGLQEGWRPLWEFPSGTPRPDVRFGTFTRGFDVGFPREVPDEFKSFQRMGLHAYHDRLLLYKPGASPELLQQLKQRVSSEVRIKTSGLRVAGSAALQARCRLASWIHREGGSAVLRPPSGSERDVIMGFPAGASALPSDPDSSFVLAQMGATGNTFLVPMISHVLQSYAAFIRQGASPLRPGWTRSSLPAQLSFRDTLAGLLPSGVSVGGFTR